MILSKIKVLKAALVTLASTAALVAPAYGSWGKDALTLQEFLDTNNTFNETMWVGAHNAYAADEWGYLDPNQTLKPRDLLEAGARQMEYDPHKDWQGDLNLCHGFCSGFEKKFTTGLDQIVNFIADNPNSVVFLKLEMKEALSKTGDKLENRLGDYIYKPRPGRIPPHSSCPGRHGIEPEYLTKAEILAEGKNVIVFAGNGAMDECPGSIGFMEWVHVGLEYEDTGWQLQYDKPKSASDSASYYDQGRMTLIHDPNTFNSINGGFSDGVFTRANVDNYMENGLNVFELYNFNGMDTAFHEDVKAKNMVWSWLENQPAGDGDCGITNGQLGGFDDVPCNYNLKYACYEKATSSWYVTNQVGHWDGGQQACTAQFGSNVEFAVPTNPRQMKKLLDTTTEWVWVNYHDQSIEGVWQANTPAKVVQKTAPVGDIARGNSFDQRYMIDRRLYTGHYTEVTAVRIRAKDRIKGLELTFSDGTVMYHGGNSGSFSDYLTLGRGNKVATAEVCVNRYDGEDRVFYVELVSETGMVISNGTRSGNCTSGTMPGDLMGFHGTGGDSYFNSLGFYAVEPENTYETPRWSVTERPVNGFSNWTTASSVKMLSGDFDGDGLDDILATGGPGWTTLPIAFSQGDGTFTVTNEHTFDFARWTESAQVKVVSGDFDGDGDTDLAATGGNNWNTMLMAFSDGDGSFTVTNHFIGEFATWTQADGVKVVSGDFNNDGLDDVAAVGGPGWNTQPIAFSNGDGTFSVTNHWIGAFPSWSRLNGAELLSGDFNGDGYVDIALAGGTGWTTQPVAYSRGDGTFYIHNLHSPLFPIWAEHPSAALLSGDFNGDGRSALAATGVPGWTTVPLTQRPVGSVLFSFGNDAIVYFGEWTAASSAKVVAGDFDGDGKDDLAVTGIHGWGSIGVAFSKQQ